MCLDAGVVELLAIEAVAGGVPSVLVETTDDAVREWADAELDRIHELSDDVDDRT